MSVIPEEVIAKAWKSDDESRFYRTFKIAGVWEKGVFDIPKDGDEGGEDYDEWQVEKAYKKLSKKHHPDKKKGLDDEEDIAIDTFINKNGKEEILERFETKEERFKMAVNIRDIIVDDVDNGWLVFEHTYEDGGESSTNGKGFNSKAKAEEYVKDEIKKLKAGGWKTAFHKLKDKKGKKEQKKVAKLDEDPDPDDWSDIEDALDDNIPEGYDIDDTGTLTGDDGIPWKEDGMYNLYMQDEDGDWDYEWILPKDTPKGLKVPKFPKKVQKFFEGAVYQKWKKNRQKQGGMVHEVDPYLGAPKPKKPKYKPTEAVKLSAKEKAEVKAYIQAMKKHDVGVKQGKFKW